MLIARSNDVRQLSFMDHCKVSQGDVLHCSRPLMGRKYHFSRIFI